MADSLPDTRAIIGHERPLAILSQALASGRVHHGWIFSGPRGVGKFTTAMHVARYLLDPQARIEQLAGSQPESTVQRLIDADTHPDLHIIRKELAGYSDNRDLREKKQINLAMDLMRERLLGGYSGTTYHEAPAYRTAAMGHGKVFIIDEAELLHREAQNAMLKTLEEPPPQTYLFLITTQPDRLLPTIHSRCQHMRFGLLSEAQMRQWVKQSPLGATPGELEWVLQFAQGSPGMARLAIEYEFAQWHHALRSGLNDLDRGVFPSSMGETLGSLIENFAQSWVIKHGEKRTSKDAANKDGSRYVLGLLAAHARRELATGRDVERWSAAIDLLREAERQLESNVNIKLLMENLVVQWAHLGSPALTT
jgi:DNA polymerase-3 subunit delta'